MAPSASPEPPNEARTSTTNEDADDARMARISLLREPTGWPGRTTTGRELREEKPDGRQQKLRSSFPRDAPAPSRPSGTIELGGLPSFPGRPDDNGRALENEPTSWVLRVGQVAKPRELAEALGSPGRRVRSQNGIRTLPDSPYPESLDAALAEYLLLSAMGQAPDLEAYCARFGERGPGLREQIRAHLSRSTASALDAAIASKPNTGVMHHFRAPRCNRPGRRRPEVLDTLAHALFLDGEVDEAVETERKALDLLDAGRTELRPYLEDSLARFEAACEARAASPHFDPSRP